MDFNKSLQYRCMIERAFTTVRRSLLGVKDCILLLAVT